MDLWRRHDIDARILFKIANYSIFEHVFDVNKVNERFSNHVYLQTK